MKRSTFVGALAVALSLMMAFVWMPTIPVVGTSGIAYASPFQVDLITRLATLETAVFGAVKTDSLQSGFLPDNLQFTTVSLSNAQVTSDLFNTGVTLLAAPGPGYLLDVMSVVVAPLAGVTTFGSGGALSVVYHGGSVSAVTSTIPATTMTGLAAGSTSFTELGPAVASNGTIIPTNTGVDIKNASGVFTGSGTVKAYIWARKLAQ